MTEYLFLGERSLHMQCVFLLCVCAQTALFNLSCAACSVSGGFEGVPSNKREASHGFPSLCPSGNDWAAAEMAEITLFCRK